MDQVEKYQQQTRQSLIPTSNTPVFQGQISECVEILKLVGKCLNSNLDDTNTVIIAAEILKDFPDSTLDEIKTALFEGAKGHYPSYKPGIFMPLNITTIYHWLELRLKNVNKHRPMIV